MKKLLKTFHQDMKEACQQIHPYSFYIFLIIVTIVPFIFCGTAVETSCKQQVDSLSLVIQDQEYQIDKLIHSCNEKEDEISYLGRMYEECSKSK